MYTLAFDTTGCFCSLILMQDDKIISKFGQKTEFGQAEMLMTQTEQTLKEAELSFRDLGLLAVCTGPGSFTGVRSSVSAARSYALVCPNLSVCGISAFEACLNAMKDEELAPINAVLIETKRDDFYVQYFDSSRRKLSAPMTAFEDEIVRALSGRKVSLTGDGVERFLNRPRGLSLHSVELSAGVPIEALARTALQKYYQKTLDFPKPLYLKAPDVCVK